MLGDGILCYQSQTNWLCLSVQQPDTQTWLLLLLQCCCLINLKSSGFSFAKLSTGFSVSSFPPIKKHSYRCVSVSPVRISPFQNCSLRSTALILGTLRSRHGHRALVAETSQTKTNLGQNTKLLASCRSIPSTVRLVWLLQQLEFYQEGIFFISRYRLLFS